NKAQPKNGKGWLYNNIEAPVVDAALIDPWNVVAGVAKHVTGKDLTIQSMQFDQADNALGWVAQTASSATGIWAYVAAGKLMGAGSRAAAEGLGAEGSAFGQIAANDKIMQIAGAGAYEFAKEPQKGQSRWTNAAGTMLSFGVFEYGNAALSRSLPLGQALGSRFAIGAVGGMTGYGASHLLGPEHSIDGGDLLRSGMTGGFMNAALPLVTEQFGKLSDATSNALGRGVPVGRYINTQGWADNAELNSLARQAPLTRVIETPDQGTFVNLDRNKIFIDKSSSPLDKQAGLGEELQHKLDANNGTFENQFQRAASLIGSDPQAARSQFIDIRRSQEASGQDAGRRVVGEQPVSVAAGQSPVQDTFHEDLFSSEADRFVESAGQFRPSVQFNHGGGAAGRGGGLDSLGSRALRLANGEIDTAAPSYNAATDTHTVYATTPGVEEPFKLHDTGEIVEGVQHEFKTNRSMERVLKANAYPRSGEYWNSVEYYRQGTETPYGIADRIERIDDGVQPRVVKFHIKEGIEGGADTGSTFEVYPDGFQTPDHEMVTSIERLEDGLVVYGKLGGWHGWDLPEDQYQQRPEGTATKIDERTDGSLYREYTNGATLDELHNPVPLVAADGTKVADVNAVFRRADGGIDYQTTDGSNIYIRRGTDQEPQVIQSKNGKEQLLDVKWPLTEQYP
ncbi:MAG: hypothetical protein ACRD3W_27460, partial [Terriglobales bacterium]